MGMTNLLVAKLRGGRSVFAVMSNVLRKEARLEMKGTGRGRVEAILYDCDGGLNGSNG